jgi:hypothetical protein
MATEPDPPSSDFANGAVAQSTMPGVTGVSPRSGAPSERLGHFVAAPSGSSSRHVAAHSQSRQPMTPELALVDPELRRLRLPPLDAGELQWEQLALAQRDGPTLDSPSAETASPSFGTLTLASLQALAVQALLGVSLLANGLLVAVVVARHTQRASLTTVSQTVTVTVPARSQPSPRSSAVPRASVLSAAARRKAAGVSRAGVERTILAVLVRSPGRRLPARLIDHTTGLAKSNLQAVCEPVSSRTYECVVRPVEHRPEEGARVRYRLDQQGHAALTWYPYRNG